MEATAMNTSQADAKSVSNGNNAAANSNASASANGRKVVYVINERNGKSYWTRIGFGSLNKDGSMNLRIDAVPVGGGTIQVRDWEPRDDTRAGERSPQNGGLLGGTSSPPARSTFI